MNLKSFILIATLFISFSGFSQNLKPVTWTYTALKDSTMPFQIIEIKATMEKGWHIFTDNPGGDGFLIPTTITINKDTKNISKITPPEIEAIPHHENMEGVGEVNYYEDEMTYRVAIEVKNDFKLTGKIEFQSCNSQMCLPPQEINFNIDIKK